MKASAKNWWILLSLLALFRVGLALRGGAVSGDDIQLLYDCFNWWKFGDASRIFTIYGSAGFIYSGLHYFGWALIAALFRFRLGPLFLVHGIMMVVPALVLGWQFRGRRETPWAIALALTSPLGAYLSLSLLPLWWISFLGGTAALQIAAAEDRGHRPGTAAWLGVGIIQGYLCSVYPSLCPLAAGLFLWLLIKRRPLVQASSYLAGGLLGLIPYFSLLIYHWQDLAPRPRIGDGSVSLLQLFGSIFRYWGIPAFPRRSNSEPAWLSWETSLSSPTPWLWAAALAVCLWAVARTLRNKQRLPAYVELAGCAWIPYLIFTAVTHTELAYHQAGNLWWISALVLVWAIQTVWKRSGPLLVAFLSLNVAGLVILFGPRLAEGTTAEMAFSGRGHGPSWWMQESIARQIKDRADWEVSLGVDTPLAVRCEQIYFLHVSLPKLFAMQYPEMDQKVRWVAEGLTNCNLLVTRDARQPYRLHLIDWNPNWSLSTEPIRQQVIIGSRRIWDKPVEIAIPWKTRANASLEFTDAAGRIVPYSMGLPSDGEVLWLRLPSLPSEITKLWAYSGGPARPPAGPRPPEEVFDYFSHFNSGAENFRTIGNGKWQVGGGICRLALSTSPADSVSTQLLLPTASLPKSGIIESRIRFPEIPTGVDAGVVFGSRPGQQAYLWNFTGYGATMLSKIDAHGVPAILSWWNAYWKPKAEKWFLISAEWNGPEMQLKADTWVGPKVVFAFFNPGENTQGWVGLGAKPGNGARRHATQSQMAFDWVRLRTSFAGAPPEVRIDPNWSDRP